jgi:AraC-like DNA-binding protein
VVQREAVVGSRLLDSSGTIRSLATWREAVRDALVPLDITADRHDFHATIGTAEVGVCHLTHIEAAGQHVLRTRALAARDNVRYLKAGIMLAGRGFFSQDQREVVLTPGDLVLYATDRPYEFGFRDDFRFGVVMLHADVAERRLPGFDDVTACLIPARSGPGRVTGAAVKALFASAGALGGPAAARAGDAVLDLIDSCVVSLAGSAASPDSAKLAMYRRACELIRLHLADPDLSPPLIAAAMGVSVSYLHRVFASFGQTVQRTILKERLAGARRDLADARHMRRTIAAIAAAWGFVDDSHFSRTFHATYGETPRSVRAGSGGAGQRPTASGAAGHST